MTSCLCSLWMQTVASHPSRNLHGCIHSSFAGLPTCGCRFLIIGWEPARNAAFISSRLTGFHWFPAGFLPNSSDRFHTLEEWNNLTGRRGGHASVVQQVLEIIGQTQVQHICVGKIAERNLKAITIAGKWKEEK